MRKFLLLIMAAFGMIASTAAATNLIREDRVWEYSMETYGNKFIFCKMKFEGTRDFNGKTYHKFITKEITYCDLVYEKSDFNKGIAVYDVKKQPYEYVDRLMREEDGKVFVLRQGYELFSERWNQEEPVTESLLYDFKLVKGDTLKSFGFPDCYGYDNYETWFPIDSVAEIIVDGEKCSLQIRKEAHDEEFIADENHHVMNEHEFRFLEGIGAVSSLSTMTNLTTAVTTGMFDDWYSLNRVFNGKGEVIIRRADLYEPAYTYCDCDAWRVPSPDVEGEITLRNPLAGVESVTGSITESELHYSDGIVSADGCSITIHDMTGKCVASGSDNVSTSTLPAGVYIARTDSNCTLKIIVR